MTHAIHCDVGRERSTERVIFYPFPPVRVDNSATGQISRAKIACSTHLKMKVGIAHHSGIPDNRQGIVTLHVAHADVFVRQQLPMCLASSRAIWRRCCNERLFSMEVPSGPSASVFNVERVIGQRASEDGIGGSNKHVSIVG